MLLFPCALLLVVAGCILPAGDGPAGRDGQPVSPATAAPGVELTATYELGKHPDPVMTFRTWAKNASDRDLYTRGQCYSPWSWTLARDGTEVQRRPPEATCQPISWADFPRGVSATTADGWNGTIWKPGSQQDPDQGRFDRAPPGDYVATIRFAFYMERDSDRYCCPTVVATEIRFTLE